MDHATRRRIIASEAQHRAQAWMEPDESSDGGAPRPSSSNMPLSVQASAAPRQHGGAVREFGGGGGGMPTSVTNSAQFIHYSAKHNPGNGHQSLPSQPNHHSSSSTVQFKLGDRGSGGAEASVFFCTLCTHRFTESSPAPGTTDRSPVLLIPCGHTVCRACVKASARGAGGQPAQGNSPPPSCPVCGVAFSATAYNKAIVASLPAFIAQSASGSGDALQDARSAAVADMAPLPPALRRALHEAAVDLTSAEAAETATRIALAHQRLASLRAGELSVAESEVHDASSSFGSQATVHDALGAELVQIEAEIRRLEVERQVVVTQLTDALQRRAHGEVRIVDCNRRYRRIAEAAAAHRHCAAAEARIAMNLVPSEAVAAVLNAPL